VGVLVGLALSVGLSALHLPLPQGVQFVLLSDRLILIPTFKWALISLLFITGVVTAISFLPALVAARMKPVTAMAHAG
jgi:ABC-type antimicrobial peptide transport system permease subunit